MKKRFILAIACLASAAPVAAEKASQKDTRQILQEFARCAVRREARAADEYVSSQPGSPMPRELLSRLPECLQAVRDEATLRGQAGDYRFAFAEALLIRKYRDSMPPDPTQAQLLERKIVTFPPDSEGESELGTLGECIVRAALTESWALLRTDAASAAEATAFKAIGPAMKTCVRNGLIVQMPAFFMRGTIAENYYRLSKAPRIAAGAAR